jgi:hypothetical protein
MRLGAIAHSRTGDKGPIVNVSVIAYRRGDYARLEREVTADRVGTHFAGLVHGEVVRYALPQLGALNFVFSRGPKDSVTQTLALDAHGKSLSSALLDMEIPE